MPPGEPGPLSPILHGARSSDPLISQEILDTLLLAPTEGGIDIRGHSEAIWRAWVAGERRATPATGDGDP